MTNKLIKTPNVVYEQLVQLRNQIIQKGYEWIPTEVIKHCKIQPDFNRPPTLGFCAALSFAALEISMTGLTVTLRR